MGFSSLDDGFNYLESFTNFEKITPQSVRDFKMDRMETLLRLFDNPQKSFISIHIAGSKGKGSTGIFLASILEQAGLKTGMYSSPHVSTYKERITLAGKFFPDELYLECINRIEAAVGDGTSGFFQDEEEGPTTFELLTLLGFTMFREAGCTHAVIETGIGGRLDATNIIEPAACVLTPIEREHTDILGNDIKQIAFEKAGIMKPEVPCFSGYQRSDVKEVLADQAAEKKSKLIFLETSIQSLHTELSRERTSVTIDWRDGTSIKTDLSMLGDFQAENAALAALAVSSIGWADQETVGRGLAAARLPGRMELLPGNPPVVLDAAHTPSSVNRTAAAFIKLFPEGRICIFGSVTGKDAESMAEIISRTFHTVIVSTPGSFKKSNPRELYGIFRNLCQDTHFLPVPADALNKARELSGGNPVLVTGSFYMISEIRKLIV